MILLVTYLFVAFVVWWLAARIILKSRSYMEYNSYLPDRKLHSPRETNGEDMFMGVFQGFFLAVFWPLIASAIILTYGFKFIFFPDKIDYKAGWYQVRKAFK